MNSEQINIINEYIETHKNELFDDLSKLIQFDTQNFITHGNESECQEYIFKKFQEYGLNAEIYFPDDVDSLPNHPDYLPGRGTDRRPNVCGTMAGKNPQKIMVSAHTDTMPVGDPDAWTVDPFGGLCKEGKIFGRGANDNKYGIAIMIFIARMFQELNIRPYFTYDFLAYIDEEFGGGNGALAGSVNNEYVNTISLDSGNYELWVSSLGGCIFRIELKTLEPTDCSGKILDAILVLKKELDIFAEKQRYAMSINPLFSGTDMEKSAFRYYDVKIGDNATNVDRGELNFVYYTDKTKEASLQELNQHISKVRSVLADTVVISDPIPTTRFFHYLQTPVDSKAVAHMKKCAERYVDFKVEKRGSCLSDLSLFLKYGSPDSFGFGVLRDFSLYGGAHQADEFVDCKEFVNVTKAVSSFMLTYRGDNEF